MKISKTAIVVCATTALAAPQEKRQSGCSSAVTLDASTNVFSKYKLHANNFYRSEVEAAAAEMSGAAAEAALRVGDIGTFLWL